MKKSRYTEEQIIGVLKQAEAGMPIKTLTPPCLACWLTSPVLPGWPMSWTHIPVFGDDRYGTF